MGQPEFSTSMVKKAEKLIELGLVEYQGLGVWFTKPIPGYNKSNEPHRVRADKMFNFSCDCQGYRIKEAKYKNLSSSAWPVCSHIAAVVKFEQLKKQKERLERERQRDANQCKFEFPQEAVHVSA